MTASEFRELGYLARKDAAQRLGRCIGKDRFDTRGVANRAITERLRHVGAHPYRCRYCGKWHLGTTIAKKGWGRGSDHDQKQSSHGGHV